VIAISNAQENMTISICRLWAADFTA